MDKNGYIDHRGRYENRANTLVPQLLQYATTERKLKATVESSYGWYWLADKLTAATIPFSLAHTAKVKAVVGKKKTDKEDSKALANLLRCNLLPTAYIPTMYERSVKELLRFRMQLVQQRGTIKRRLHDILAKQNISADYSDILGKKSITWLQSLNCPDPYKQEITSCLTIANTLTTEIDTITKEVQAKAIRNETAALLMTIPGIGEILALTLTVEIGDITRFASDRALSSYAGVVPSVYSSGDKTHYGPTRQGNQYIRWALAEALVHILRKDSGMHDFYEKIAERKGGAKARVAVMNKLLRAMYAMLTKHRAYQLTNTIMKQSAQTADPLSSKAH